MDKKNSRKDDSARNPENNPSKAMDSKREVEQSPDEKTDQDFPGYPHYPAKEDIMDQRTDSHRVDMDVENLPSNKNATGVSQRFASSRDDQSDEHRAPATEGSDDLGIQMGTEADVSPEEVKMLQDDTYLPTPDEDNLRQARLDDTDFDGEPLNEGSFGVGDEESGDDLDLDTGPDETRTEALGQGDEENNYYSLGSADNDNVVEGTP